MPKKAKICSNYALKNLCSKLCFFSKKSILFAQKHNYAPNGNTFLNNKRRTTRVIGVKCFLMGVKFILLGGQIFSGGGQFF